MPEGRPRCPSAIAENGPVRGLRLEQGQPHPQVVEATCTTMFLSYGFDRSRRSKSLPRPDHAVPLRGIAPIDGLVS